MAKTVITEYLLKNENKLKILTEENISVFENNQ